MVYVQVDKPIPCLFVFGFQLCCPRAWGKKTYDLNTTTMFHSNEYVEVNDDDNNDDDDDTIVLMMMLIVIVSPMM